jgi:sporulation protein YlmC with PRC-barrel domain
MVGTTHHSMHSATMLTAFVRWAAPQLVVYVITVLAATAAFIIGAALYAYLWPAPTAPLLPNEVAPIGVPNGLPGGIKKHIPGESTNLLVAQGAKWITASSFLRAKVFDVNNVRVGDVREVLLTPKGNAEGVVIVLTDLTNGAMIKKSIVVPFHKVKWTSDPSSKAGGERAVVQYTASQLQAVPAFPPH